MKQSQAAFYVMTSAHDGQTRFDGKTPYSTHPEKVVEILKTFGVTDDEVLSAAYLHDVLEDTKYTVEKLEEQFSSGTVSLVKELTFKKFSYDSEYVEHCKYLSDKAKLIKIADILANITDQGRKSDHFIRKRVAALQAMLVPELELVNL